MTHAWLGIDVGSNGAAAGLLGAVPLICTTHVPDEMRQQ